MSLTETFAEFYAIVIRIQTKKIRKEIDDDLRST